MGKAIPAGLVSPPFRGWSRTMKESAELGARVTQLLCGQHLPPGCMRPNDPFSTGKNQAMSTVPRYPE